MSGAVPDARAIRPFAVSGQTVDAPASKSHAIRLLLCAALADGVSRIVGLPAGEDIEATLRGLHALGVEVDRDADGVSVHGVSGRWPHPTAELDLGGSGTAFRLLAGLVALGPGPYVLTGDATLRARPVGAVADALDELGLDVRTDEGRPPLCVSGGPPDGGGRTIVVDGSASSHPVSALVLLAPWLPGGLTVEAREGGVSRGYVELTRQVVAETAREIFLAEVEGDWSSSALLLVVPALRPGACLRVRGLSEHSAQPDRAVLDLLRDYGTSVHWESADTVVVTGGERRPLDVCLRDTPDLAPVVGALGCSAAGETVVRGAAHLRAKESDRIASVVAAARAVGCDAEESDDGFVLRGGAPRGGEVDAQRDHRIAMAFGALGTAVPGVRIRGSECVAKSYPAFWDVLDGLAAG